VKQRRIPRTQLAEIRRQFARMLDEGLPAESIMAALKLSRTTYFQWKKKYLKNGLDGLKVRPLPGAAPKLTDQQTSQLRGWLVGRDRKHSGASFGPGEDMIEWPLWVSGRRRGVEGSRDQVGARAGGYQGLPASAARIPAMTLAPCLRTVSM
jgi:transposase